MTSSLLPPNLMSKMLLGFPSYYIVKYSNGSNISVGAGRGRRTTNNTKLQFGLVDGVETSGN